jgi:protein O-mannosyl-transferase
MPASKKRGASVAAAAPRRRLAAALLAAALIALSIAAYWPIRHHPFTNFDDPQYVAENQMVIAGLTSEGARWAFTTGHAGNWHPVTWLSHMLDVDLFGVRPGAHHTMNLVWHSATTLLLFGWLRRVTGAAGRSAFVAAMFAVHPLHVESVAWIAERKDVLSAFFWMATVSAYTSYVRRPTAWRYAMVLVTFALGLMSKPMLVTLPFVLALLHVWPLRDERDDASIGAAVSRHARPLLPLVAMALASSVVTFLVQQQAGAVRSLDVLPLSARIGNAVVAYVTYLWQAVWPADLAPIYPYAPHSTVSVIGAAMLLTAVSAFAWRLRRTAPYFLVGWCWFLGTLVPVIGLVQVGSQPVADRYTYIPFIGLAIAVAWGAEALVRRATERSALRTTVAAGAVVIVLVWAGLTRVQASHWRTSVSLWQHATAAVPGNYRAHSNLGHALEAEGRLDDALAQYAESVRLRPQFAEGRNRLGSALLDKGRVDEAITELREAVRILPSYVPPHNNLGLALAAAGQMDEAVTQFREAIRLDPEFAPAHANLGVAYANLGRMDDAIVAFDAAMRLQPQSAQVRTNLARALTDRGRRLVQSGRLDDAMREFDAAVTAQPNFADAHHERGRALAALGKLDDSLKALMEASRLAPSVADYHYDVAVVLVRLSRSADALQMLQAALTVDPNHAEARAAATALLKRGR